MIGIEVVTIGGEILNGRTPDTNFLFLARGLASLGLPCRWHTTVPDDRETLSAALETALGRAHVIVTTGGLGPTSDDITRKILASVLKRQLILREDLLAALAERYRRLGRNPPATMQSQALIPFGADLIDNALGSAPGLRLRVDQDRVLYALPGVPHEMERMAERFVLPDIAGIAPSRRVRERILRTVGVSETRLAELVAPVTPREVGIAYLPHLGKVDLRFTAEGRVEEADALLEETVGRSRGALGSCVYAEGTEELEETVGRLLLGRGWLLAVSESLTGGAVGSRLVAVPGASRYFLGDVVAYDNAAKISILGVPAAWIRDHGAVSAPVAEAMAHGARERFGADVAVSTTGIAGPDGGTPEKPAGLVFVGIAWPGGRVAVRHQFAGERGQVIERSVTTALDLVRRAAAGHPIPSSP
jgi:nicotinamide-nucleotide amidase